MRRFGLWCFSHRHYRHNRHTGFAAIGASDFIDAIIEQGNLFIESCDVVFQKFQAMLVLTPELVLAFGFPILRGASGEKCQTEQIRYKDFHHSLQRKTLSGSETLPPCFSLAIVRSRRARRRAHTLRFSRKYGTKAA